MAQPAGTSWIRQHRHAPQRSTPPRLPRRVSRLARLLWCFVPVALFVALPRHLSADVTSVTSHIAGEILMKVTPAAAQAIEAARQAGTLPTTGIASLDDILAEHRIQTIEPLFGPTPSAETIDPERARRKPKDAESPDLSSIYMLRVAHDTDILSAVDALSHDPHVVYAQPNYVATTNEVEVTP